MPHLAFVLFSYFPHGGLQRDFLRILRGCLERGARVTVFVMNWEGDVPDGARVRLHVGRGWSGVARRRGFVNFVLRETEAGGFDAVVGFNRMPGLDYYFAADSCFAEKALRRRSRLYRLTPRCRQYLAFERAVFGAGAGTRVLMLSSLQERQYREFYPIGDGRLIRLPPGISPDRKAGEDAAALREGFRRELAIPGDRKVLLHVGSGFAVKGLDRSIRALAALPDEVRQSAELLVVGRDKPGPYVRLAKKLRVAGQVRFLSGRGDVPRCLQGADLLLHPARSESAGHVLLEAVVAGLPVLTTDTCGFACHVLKAGAGLVCESPFRQEALNRLLLDMLASGKLPLWRENGIGYGRVEDLYDMPDKVADLLCAGEGSKS